MYCFNGKSCSSLLIESTNSMTCNCLYYFSHTVPANEVSVKLTTPQPSCISEKVNLICNVSNSSAIFIQWNITKNIFSSISFTNLDEIGSEIMLFGRIIANLTENSGGLVSSLTILPPLNNVWSNDLNNTIIGCIGGVNSTDLGHHSLIPCFLSHKEVLVHAGGRLLLLFIILIK